MRFLKAAAALLLTVAFAAVSNAATLVARQNNIMRLDGTYGFFKPASAYTVVVYRMGAVCSGAPSGVNIPVRTGHAMKVGDKIGVFQIASGSFVYSGSNTVSSISTTQLTMTGGTYTASDGDLIVSLGADAATGSTPNFTASDLQVFKGPSSTSTTYTNSRVTTAADGEYLFWMLARAWWEVILQGSTGAVLNVVVHRASPEVTPFEFGYAGSGTIGAPWTGWESAITNQTAAVRLFFPEGYYSTGTEFLITYRGFEMRGEGKDVTQILFTGASKSLLSFGSFSTTPATLYAGTAQYYKISDLTLYTNEVTYGIYEGVRTNSGIRDNGSGSGTVSNVLLRGWQYGYAMPYGGDGNRQENVSYSHCDVGLYMGPGSDQNTVESLHAYTCREAVVIEGARHLGMYTPDMVDQKISDVTFEYNTTTRFGLGGAYPAAAKAELNCDIWNPLFESDADSGNGRIPPRHVWANTAGASSGSLPRYVRIHNPRLISGGTASADNAFLELSAGTRFEVRNLLVEGNQIKWVVKRASGNTGAVTLVNPRTVDGYTTTALWGKSAAADTTAGRLVIRTDTANPIVSGYEPKVTIGDGTDQQLQLCADSTTDGCLTYQAGSNDWALTRTLNMSAPILMASGSRIDAYRVQGNKGTAQVAGDFALGAGWGNAASVAVTSGSRDPRFEITVTSSGTGQSSATATVTLTFKDGAWTAAPFADCNFNGGTGTSAHVTWTSTTTALVMTYPALPVAASTYKIACQVQG